MRSSAAGTRPTMPLTFVSPGETAELIEIRLSGNEKQRLQELGLLPGTSLRVVKSDPALGLIVSVRQDGRLALNRSTAQRILVSLGGEA